MMTHALVWSSLAMQAGPDPAAGSLLWWIIQTAGPLNVLLLVALGSSFLVGACMVATRRGRAVLVAKHRVLLSVPLFAGTLLWLNAHDDDLVVLTFLFVLLSGLAIFIGACLVVARSRRTSTIAAYLVLLPLPTYLFILGELRGMSDTLSRAAVVLGELSDAEWADAIPELAGGIAADLFRLFVCLLVTLASYLVLAYGLLASTRNFSASTTR